MSLKSSTSTFPILGEKKKFYARPTSGGFSPMDVAGLQIWLKADTGMFQNSNGTTAVTANDDPVGYWADQSGNSNHATQPTSNARPLYKTSQQNGFGAIKGDAVDDFMLTPINTGDTWNVFAVILSATATFNSYWGVFDSSINDNLHEWMGFRPSTTNYWFLPAGVRKNKVTLAASYDLTPISSSYFLVNVQCPTKQTGIRQLLRCGGFYGNGYIMEMCAYSSYLTGANITNVEDYFMNKFAIV